MILMITLNNNSILTNKNFFDLIKYPLITSKTCNLAKNNKYTFIINECLTKTEIKFVFETLFKIKIQKINTIPLSKLKLKKKITKNSKKVIFTALNSLSLNNLFNYK